nr:hypothetical protein [Halomonas sp. 1513]
MAKDYDLELLSELSGVAPLKIKSLLGLLMAPDDNPQLLLVLTNLRCALKAVERFPSVREDLEGRDINEGEGSLFGYLDVISRLADALSVVETPKCPDAWLESSGNPRGIINAHPEWAMLIFPHDAKCHEALSFWQHAGVVIACSFLQRARHRERIGSEITAACRDIRSIANGKYSHELLNEINENDTLDTYHLNYLIKDDEIVKQLSGVELLVRKVLRHKGKTREGGGSGGSKGKVVEIKLVEADDGDEENEGPEQSVQLLESIDDEHTQSRQRAVGLHPKEDQALRAVSFSESKSSPTLGFDPYDLVRRQELQVKHISSTNQRLPYRYSSLSRIELAVAAREAVHLFSGHGRFEERDDIGVYAGLLLMLMIWLGRPVDQILEMRVYPDIDALPESKKNVIAFLAKEQAFVLPIPSPESRNSLQEDAKRLLYEAGESVHAHVDDAVIVASPVRIHKFLSRIVMERKKRTKYRIIFPEDLRQSIEVEMRSAVSRVNRSHRMRLTPLRISQALFDEVVRCSSDWVDAYLLTGHQFTITEVAAHYYSVPAGYLVNLYHEAVLSLRNDIYQHLNVDERNYYNFNQLINNDGDHGSKLNIKPMLLVRLVRHLKHDLRSSSRLPLDEETWREVHNSLVAYIAFWLLFATGFRAVNDLVFRWREIDFDTGFLVISDKDDESMSQARVVWLLPELREQIRYYASHLAVLQSRVFYRESLHDQIEEVLSEPHSNVPLMFFISESWQMVKLSPENLRRQVPIFTLPINSSRHYLRSALRSEGIRAEVVNAFMGHAQQGQEPFGASSTLTPVEMFRELAPTLSKMRQEAGWTAQLGLADG